MARPALLLCEGRTQARGHSTRDWPGASGSPGRTNSGSGHRAVFGNVERGGGCSLSQPQLLLSAARPGDLLRNTVGGLSARAFERHSGVVVPKLYLAWVRSDPAARRRTAGVQWLGILHGRPPGYPQPRDGTAGFPGRGRRRALFRYGLRVQPQGSLGGRVRVRRQRGWNVLLPRDSFSNRRQNAKSDRIAPPQTPARRPGGFRG